MTRVAVIYYSASGNVHALAQAVADGAEEAGAEVRRRHVEELASELLISQNQYWGRHRSIVSDEPVATLDDLEWADGVSGSAARPLRNRDRRGALAPDTERPLMTTILERESRMPSLAGATEWLGSEPLTPADLRGRVVLIDFGTYTCINWLRTLPHIRAWAEKYREHGLVVVGIQTPEFDFEQNLDSVRREVKARGLDWPVAVDNDYEIWRAFSNHYWPALYFVDREGVIRHHHFGEGRYEQSERVIQQLLGLAPQDLVSVHGEGDEAEADWARLNSPETYLGDERSGNFASPDGLKLNQWARSGDWTVERERIRLNAPGGRIFFRFQARDVHLVLRRTGQGEPVRFRVLLDGEGPGAAHGVDADADGNGHLDEDRLYQLVRQPEAVEERTFEITFHAGGVEAYVFTFG